MQAKALAVGAVQQLQRARQLVPASQVPRLVKRRLDRTWAKYPEFQQRAESQMRNLLEFTDRADEAPELAKGYAEYQMLRAWLRWHPKAITRFRVVGLEWLTTEKDPSRGILLSFFHHARYDGMWGSLVRAGAPRPKGVSSPLLTGRGAPIALRQHGKLCQMGGDILPHDLKTDQLAEVLQAGEILALASDVPGRNQVTFLGRPVLAPLGAARLATMSNSPVVLVRTFRDEQGPYLQLSPPMEPGDFAEPTDLLQAIVDGHGEAALAWPEAVDTPKARFGQIEG